MGGSSWNTSGRVTPRARHSGSIVGPGAVRSSARRPSCSTSISLRSARSSTSPFRQGEAARGERVYQFLAQHQCEERAEDVAADGSIGAVEEWPCRQQRLGGEKALFHGQQVAVAQHHLQGEK